MISKRFSYIYQYALLYCKQKINLAYYFLKEGKSDIDTENIKSEYTTSDLVNKCKALLSINTDDRGIFHTSLENEYAFLAASLENLTDENGEKRYLPQQIYDWLDHIRKMGNQQVF